MESFSKCGRSKQKADAKRKYPKCVPLAKARSMSDWDKDVQLSKEKEQLHKVLVVNQQTLKHLQKENKL